MTQHTRTEDALAIVTGVTLVSTGIAFLAKAGLLTGGIAGLSFVLHYTTGWSFGLLFFVLNLPFYWLGLRRMGWRFTLKTFAAVALLSLMTEAQLRWLHLSDMAMPYAALVGGLIMAMGFLVLFRHQSSLGGVGILALYLQEHRGWRAGKVQMAVDSAIVATALVTLALDRVLWSVVCAVVLNLVLAMNHKPGRYVAT
ncbi:YitT family protein [Comamonas sp. NLF-1-9]|uniref:YitT family protein n=1 Tax=Comamonas sp. NLF-1-9 TaxID=2853163 RepID=UPI001C476C22|nr:YitT family protein [Comamonas sp. NLF-1-9]QXL84794.1 YitT family protein [Comamonas sp. NLF-1-9]